MDTNITKNLPTDNLYKFLAIFGLAIFILSFFIPDYYNNKILSYRDYIREEMGNFESNLNNSIEKMKISVDRMAESREELAELMNENIEIYTEDQYNNLIKDHEELRKEVIEGYDDLINNTQVAHDAINKFNNSAIGNLDKTTKKYIKDSEILTKSCLFVGAFFMIFGFIMWYFKTQRYLDWILRERGEKLKRENIFNIYEDKLYKWLRKKITKKNN